MQWNLMASCSSVPASTRLGAWKSAYCLGVSAVAMVLNGAVPAQFNTHTGQLEFWYILQY